jgi:Synergist-CTERM protein sorting domain-containing protein
MAGFVQNVRVKIASGTLRLVATNAGPTRISAFNDNVFRSLEIVGGATFRLDDDSAPNNNNASVVAGFDSYNPIGGGAAVARLAPSVWARLDGLSGSGTIDLGSATPVVTLNADPATLTADAAFSGNGIDFNFSGNVDNRITGMGGIRVWGGRTVRFTNTANDFEGPILINGTLEVSGDHTTGDLNNVYVGSGGGIKAVNGVHSIESHLLFDKNSYIYTDVTDGKVSYLDVKGGIQLASAFQPGDKIKLTAPLVNAKAGDNVIILHGDGVNTLVDRIMVSDNNGAPVLDKWAVRATVNNELVLNALQDVNDGDNPNPGGPTDPGTPPPPPAEVPAGIAIATSKTATTVTVNVTYGNPDKTPAVGKTVTVTLTGGAAPESKTVTIGADGKGLTTFTGLTANTSYTISAADSADASIKAPDETVKTDEATTPPPGGETGSGSGGGGCDAGFAGAVLLLAAPLFLRKGKKAA